MFSELLEGELAPELVQALAELEPAEAEALIDSDPEFVADILKEYLPAKKWTPLVGVNLDGPQMMAYNSEAFIIGYGGAAGGGKTDLACGMAINAHQRTFMVRREATQLTGIIDRLSELLDGREGYNGSDKIWRRPDIGKGIQINFGSVPHAGDEAKYQGIPKDLLVIDEAANFLESQVRFLTGWVRGVDPEQPCRVLMTFNPPTTAEGQWILDYFAPWLQPEYPNPALPGEIRYMAMIDGQDTEVPDGRPFVLNGEGERVYDFNPDDHIPTDIIKPQSRTFIPSRITDNPYLMETGYMGTLQSLPEPLRSQMLNGDFGAGLKDDAWQVIPSAWVKAAQDRWVPPEPGDREMTGLGVDCSRGGDDLSVLAPKYKTRKTDYHFDELTCIPGNEVPDGPTLAGRVVAARRDNCPVQIDIVNVGTSVYDFLKSSGIHTVGFNGATRTLDTDQSGRLRFANLRSQLYWQMRECLDPENNTGIMLPPDPGLRADLCAPTFSVTSMGITVEPKVKVVDRIGRSPDKGDAVVTARYHIHKQLRGKARNDRRRNDYDPFNR